jgi:hypothetical protein
MMGTMHDFVLDSRGDDVPHARGDVEHAVNRQEHAVNLHLLTRVRHLLERPRRVVVISPASQTASSS